MKPIPIFDTQIFSHFQNGLISDTDWQRLHRKRPSHGWPISSVTALELLAGLAGLPAQKYPRFREQVELAFELSNGHVLHDPKYLFCTEVLGIPFPPGLVAPSGHVLANYLEAVRHSQSLAELGRYVTDMSVVRKLLADPKKEWIERTHQMATAIYPQWRECSQLTGRRLPPELREVYKPWSIWDAQRIGFVQSMLTWLEASADAQLLGQMAEKLDAVLNFTMYVAREFLINNYSVENHDSDVFDQFQLHYLVMDEFIIVSHDSDLPNRTSRSSQANRIMLFSDFLEY